MKKILVIEDRAPLRENLIEMLSDEKFDCLEAANGVVGVQLALQQRPDLIICDVMLPELDGYGVLQQLRNNPQTASIPFIFLTAKGEKQDMRQGMSLGADDYLTKPCGQEELLEAIATRLKKQAVTVAPYRRALKRAAERVDNLTNYDSLTQLPNRQMLSDCFQQILNNLGPEDRQRVVAVIVLGLDRFHRINDTLGHKWGDLLLKAVAKRLKNSVSKSDAIARIEGDIFAIILTSIKQRQQASGVAKILLERVSQPFTIEGREVFLTASIGMGFYPRDGQDMEKLLQVAMAAMRNAKQQGGNQYQLRPTGRVKVSRRMQTDVRSSSTDMIALSASLYYALEREELELWYQPQVSLQNGKIVGAEALLRWQHPERGLILPGKFIPIAEETGLILEIGKWVLQKACRQTKVWQNMGYASLRVAVNLSARQFGQPDLRRYLVDILLETGLEAKYLEIELTESTIVQNEELAIGTLMALKTLGIKIALDDFGTGYSSLGYLQKFPFDILKIDRLFVHNIAKNTKNQALTKGIIEMAHNLELKVIAEGVETVAEREFLRKNQCDEMQGYLFSRPLNAKGFQQLLFYENAVGRKK